MTDSHTELADPGDREAGWVRQLTSVSAWRYSHNRWPTATGNRAAYAWLRHQIVAARSSPPSITGPRRAQLDQRLPGWRDAVPVGARSDIWQRRLNALAAFVAQTGRLPKVGQPGEAALAQWLLIQRRAAAGRTGQGFTPARRQQLDEKVPQWSGDGLLERRWLAAVAEVEQFVATAGRSPSSHPRSPEHRLGCWVLRQRSLIRARRLSAGRVAVLDARLPWWRSPSPAVADHAEVAVQDPESEANWLAAVTAGVAHQLGVHPLADSLASLPAYRLVTQGPRDYVGLAVQAGEVFTGYRPRRAGPPPRNPRC